MKKIMATMIAILLITILTACDVEDTHVANAAADNSTATQSPSRITTSVVYITFEEALLSSTDVVIAHYVGHRPFGENLIEFEFSVIDRVFGNAADTIFVYATNSYASIMGGVAASTYNQSALMFNRGTNYLLPLQRLEGAHLRTHEDGYLFIHNLIMNLDNPHLSTMYNEPLSLHSSEVSFESRSLADEAILTFVSEKTANNRPAREHIRSENMEDIINGSPHVFIVEINEPRRLVSQQVTRDWGETDIYHATVVRTLKGNLDAGLRVDVVFFADTVQTGEQHIVAVERIERGSTTFRFTSRNSLFRMDQLDEILEIIGY